MKRRVALQLAFCGLIAGSQAIFAGTSGLADWCVNLNGDTSTACNGAGSGGPSGAGSISLASFDTTPEPATNSLGSVTITLGVGSNQYANFYADYDLDYGTYGSYDDVGSVNGALPAGVTYELDDPNTSNIFSDFAANTLANTNNVGTAATPPNQCCDVSFALGVGGLDVLAGGSGTVTFTVGTAAPASGFYIQQTNCGDQSALPSCPGDSIYLTETTNIVNPSPTSGTPEPSTFGLGLIACVGAILSYARSRKRAGLVS